MGYKYYSKTYYSTVCHIMEFDPREFRLDVTRGVSDVLETLPKIAGEPKADEKVIAKMNASFFAMNGKGGDTYSTLVDEGNYYHASHPGYPTLIFWKDYTMSFEHDPTQERIEYYQKNAFFAIGVGWTLVIDGKANYTYDKQKLISIISHAYTRNPRTMIGQKADGTTGSSGLTTPHMSDIMLKLGCKIAANMDGGGSSEMYIDGKTVNKLQSNYHRKIGTAFMVYGPKTNNQIVIKEADVKYTKDKIGTVVNAANVRVRSGPGTSYSQIGAVPKGAKLTIFGANSTGKWYKFKNSDYEAGWISALYVTVTTNTTTSSSSTSTPNVVYKTATANLRIRDGRGTKYKQVGLIAKGTKVEVSDLKSGWYKVKYKDVVGYSYSGYLK